MHWLPSALSLSWLGTEPPRGLVLESPEPGGGENVGEHELEILVNVLCVLAINQFKFVTAASAHLRKYIFMCFPHKLTTTGVDTTRAIRLKPAQLCDPRFLLL